MLPSGPMKRAAGTMLSLICSLGILLASTACEEKTGSGKGPDSSRALYSPDPDADETVLPPSPALEAGSSEVAPGLGSGDLIGPLRDAYDRMDPTKDGWESEAFRPQTD